MIIVVEVVVVVEVDVVIVVVIVVIVEVVVVVVVVTYFHLIIEGTESIDYGGQSLLSRGTLLLALCTGLG